MIKRYKPCLNVRRFHSAAMRSPAASFQSPRPNGDPTQQPLSAFPWPVVATRRQKSGVSPLLAWEPQLEELGHLLDRDQFPDVFDGGFVAPGVAIDSFDAGEEKTNVSPRQKTGPTTRSWQRPEAWQGPPNSPAPIVRPDLQAFYEEDLAKVHASYPGARVWREEDGLWLRTESALLQSAPRRAVFITAVPYSNNQVLRAWAFLGWFRVDWASAHQFPGRIDLCV